MFYFGLDVESTGLKCGYHEITEISILNCQTMDQVTWLIKIKYKERCSKEAMYITQKTPEELENRGRYIEDVLDEITEFILKGAEKDEVCIIAHNASFDRRFVTHAYVSNNKENPIRYWLCTKEMSKKYCRTILGLQKTSHALNNLLITANIKTMETDNIHSSEVDTRNMYRLWKKMTLAGISNTEFIKMAPEYLNEVKATPIKKKGKKAKAEEYSLDDIMEEQTTESFFEEEKDD